MFKLQKVFVQIVKCICPNLTCGQENEDRNWIYTNLIHYSVHQHLFRSFYRASTVNLAFSIFMCSVVFNYRQTWIKLSLLAPYQIWPMEPPFKVWDIFGCLLYCDLWKKLSPVAQPIVMSTRLKLSFLFTNWKLNVVLGGDWHSDTLWRCFDICGVKGKHPPSLQPLGSLPPLLSSPFTRKNLICGFFFNSVVIFFDISGRDIKKHMCGHVHMYKTLLYGHPSSDFHINWHL